MGDIDGGTGQSRRNGDGQKGLVQQEPVGQTKRDIARSQCLIDTQLLPDPTARIL